MAESRADRKVAAAIIRDTIQNKSMPNSNTDQSGQQQSQPSGGKSRAGLYIGIACAAVLVVAVLAYSLGSSSGVQPGTIGTENGTPVYMPLSGIESFMGPSTNYSASDLFNYSSSANISIIESFTPLAAGNVTGGWVTFANSQNATENATVQYYVMEGYNSSKVASSIAANASSEFATPPETQYGSYNGLSYTYEVYRNSTLNFQLVTGWKANYTVFTLLISNSSFTANQTALMAASADSIS